MPRGAPSPAAGGRRPNRRRLRSLSLAALVVMVSINLVLAWLVQGLVRDQERSLLRERAGEVAFIAESRMATVQARLELAGTVALVSNGSPESFAAIPTPPDPGLLGTALLRPAPDGFVADLVAGRFMVPGQLITGARADAMRRAMSATAMVNTPVMSDRMLPSLGFAPAWGSPGLTRSGCSSPSSRPTRRPPASTAAWGGLAISRRLVEMMGGTIGVESRVGRGSTFFFTALLPAGPSRRAPGSKSSGGWVRPRWSSTTTRQVGRTWNASCWPGA